MTKNERKIAGVSWSVPLLPFPNATRKQISVKTTPLSTPAKFMHQNENAE